MRMRLILLLVIAAVVIMMALAIGYVHHARRESHAALIRATIFREVMMHLREHAGSDGVIPLRNIVDDRGTPLLSWRLWLAEHSLPQTTRADYSKNWSDPRNEGVKKLGIWFTTFDQTRAGNTTILAIAGPGTAAGQNSPVTINEAPEDLIVLVEVRNSGVDWMAPVDFDIQSMPRRINDPDGRGISGTADFGFHIAFLDGEVWCMSSDTPFEELERFFTIHGAAQLDREVMLRRFCRARLPFHGRWQVDR